jgi:hypothetical protein
MHGYLIPGQTAALLLVLFFALACWPRKGDR